MRHVSRKNFSSLLANSLYNLPQDLGVCSAVSASCLQLLFISSFSDNEESLAGRLLSSKILSGPTINIGRI